MHLDWSTLALQTLNVLILIWILAKFLFRPMRDIIAKRQAQTQAVLAEAAALKQQAADAKAEADKAREQIQTQRKQLLADAHAAAAAEKARLLDAAQTEISKARAEAAAARARDQKQLEGALIARIKNLAVEIVQRLLERISPDAGLDGFVDELCVKLKDARVAWQSASDANAPIEVLTAAQLPAEVSARLRERLKVILGSDAVLKFSVDPALIAGLELHSRTLSLSNSLRQDLDRIVKELDFGA